MAFNIHLNYWIYSINCMTGKGLILRKKWMNQSFVFIISNSQYSVADTVWACNILLYKNVVSGCPFNNCRHRRCCTYLLHPTGVVFSLKCFSQTNNAISLKRQQLSKRQNPIKSRFRNKNNAILNSVYYLDNCFLRFRYKKYN